ncbi:MAG: hypothetical protein J6J78_09390 [Clostridia bacterium]|nr:hypothetical protein [Clostridia bacterium]
MINILKKLLAAWLVCVLLAGMVPSLGLAEGTPDVVSEEPAPAPKPDPTPEPKPDPTPEPKPDPTPEPKPEPTPEPKPEPTPVPEPDPTDGVLPPETGDDGGAPEASDSPSGEPEKAEDCDDASSPEETKVPADPTPGPDAGASSDAASPEATIVPDGTQLVDPQPTEKPELFIVEFDTSALPVGKNVPYGTPEGELGFPAVLKAVWSDGSISDVNVSWRCIDDDNGGTAYIPEHENPAAVYTFQAVLEGEEICNAEMPVIYVAYEAVASVLMLEPLVWTDVFLEVDEKEYETTYKSIAFNVLKEYELALSLTEDESEEPDLELKYEIDPDSPETHNIVAFQKLESDTEYTVWAREIDTEDWIAFAQTPVKTDPVYAKLIFQGEAVDAGRGICAGETVSVETNLEEPKYSWYRADQEAAVSDGPSYTLSLGDVGAAVKCSVSEDAYSGESAEVQALPFAPVEFKLDTAAESLTVVFPEPVPVGANVVLENAANEAFATAEVTESASEFEFENMRAQAGNTMKAYLSFNGVKGAEKEFAVAALNAEPEQPGQDQIVFAASSQRSIDFSCTDAAGLEFAYGVTESEDAPVRISANPELLSGLAAQTSYTLFMRSAASETGFASEWVDSGFSATTGQLEVAIAQADGVYFDSVVAASPVGTYLFEEGYPVYQWYFSDEAAFDENAELLDGVQGAELNLPECGFTKADIGKYIFVTLSDGYGNTSAAATAQLRRHDDPLLSIDVDERIAAGETVSAVFNGDAAELVWQWKRGEEVIPGANVASYTATAQDAYNVLTVNAIQNEAVVASAYVAVDMCVPAAAVDYVKETIAVSVDCAMPDGWMLRAIDENGVSVDKNWPEGESSASYKLADLGIDPDKHDASAPDYTVSLVLMNGNGRGEELQLTLPTRLEYSEMTIDMDAVTRASASELTFAVPSEFNMALSADGAGAPDFSLGSGPSFSLKEGTKYKVWLRDVAVQGVSFASKWMDMHTVQTGTRREVSVSLKDTSIAWKPNMEIPGITISSGEVSKNDVHRSWYDANGKSLSGEPVNAGKYTMKLSLKGNAAKWYKLKEDKLSLTIEPMVMSAKNTRVTCEQLTYNGREQLPQKMKIIVDGVEIPAGEFKTEKVSGYDCIKAGSHIIKVVGNGNVTGGIKILYVISVAKPASISWPTASYLVTGQRLSESKLTGGSTSAGSFAWERGSIIPSAGISKHNVVFTPADTSNYDWTGVTMVKPIDVKVYSVAMPGADGSSAGAGSDYNYDFSASSGYWEGYDYDGGYDFSGGYEIGEVENSSNQLADTYLSVGSGKSGTDALGIVYDVVGQPMDYELLSIQNEIEGDEGLTDHTFMVIAQPDMEGEIVSRVLRLSLAQVDYLHIDKDFSNLLFRNGDAELYLRKEELLTGNAGKLAAYMIATGSDEIDLMELDFDAMEEPAFTRDELSGLWVEARIDPVVIAEEGEEEEREAWDVSLWLCTDYTEVEISTLVPSFTVCLNVNGIFDEGMQDLFLARNGLALMDENNDKLLLESELVQMPGELPVSQPDEADYYTVLMPIDEGAEAWTDYIPDMTLNPYRNYVLATPYAGAGMYMLTGLEEDF